MSVDQAGRGRNRPVTVGSCGQQTLTDGQVYTFAYTEVGGRIAETVVTQPGGIKRRYEFDSAGAVTEVTDAHTSSLARDTVIARGLDHRADAVTDDAGRRTDLHYDAQGRLSHATRLAGTPEAIDGPVTAYGPLDRPRSITNELGKTTTFGHDGHGNLTRVTDPLGRETTATYNAAGQVLTATDPADKTSTNIYRLGELTTATDPTGATTRLFADALGRVTSVTAASGATSSMVVDVRNLVTRTTDPLGQSFNFTYDNNGNIDTVTDPRSNPMDWDYDNSDRVKKVTDPLGRFTTIEYKPTGQVAKTTSRRNKVTTFDYNDLYQPTTIRYGVTATGAESTVGFTYDPAHGDAVDQITDTAAGGPTDFDYDPLDRPDQVTGPTGTVGYTYDDADQRQTATATGQDPVTYDYDDAGALIEAAQGAVVASPHYDDAGRQDRIDLPGGWSRSYGFDDASRVNSINHTHGGTNKGALGYTYDPAGQIRSVTGTGAKVALPAPVSGLVYDDNNRLTSRAGTTLTYDNDGNLTNDGATGYTWNARGQLTGLNRTGLSATFRYDALGERDRRIVGGATTSYLNDAGNPITETDAAGTANLLSGGVDEWFARTPPGGAPQSYLTDIQGSTLGLGAADGSQPAG